MSHKAFIGRFHSSLFAAAFLTSFQDFQPVSFLSFSTILPQVVSLSLLFYVKYSSLLATIHFPIFLTARSCFLPLGMESGHLLDGSISASTYYGGNHIPQFSRLNKIPASGKAGAWCTRTNNGNEWLQVYFGRETTVTKVATQGRYDTDQRVTSYSLSYSVDGSHWARYRLSDGRIKV